MKSSKTLIALALLTFGSLGAASAGERKYDPSMPAAAVQQHERYVKGLERAAALDAKRAKAQVASPENTSTDAAAITGAITTIIIIAALL